MFCCVCVRDNYGFVAFAHYDGACAAVERKFCFSYSNIITVPSVYTRV